MKEALEDLAHMLLFIMLAPILAAYLLIFERDK